MHKYICVYVCECVVEKNASKKAKYCYNDDPNKLHTTPVEIRLLLKKIQTTFLSYKSRLLIGPN